MLGTSIDSYLAGLGVHLVYSTVALAEVFVLLASAIGAMFLIVRAILRAVFRRKDATTARPSKEDLRHLKRAGSGFSG